MSAFGWAVITAVVWGIVPLMEKAGLGAADPVAGVVVRSLGVVGGLVLFSVVKTPWDALRGLSGSSILLLMGGGLLASFIGQMAFYHALKAGALSQVTPVAGTYPLVAACLGWILLREPLTVARVAGVLLVVSGVALLRR